MTIKIIKRSLPFYLFTISKNTRLFTLSLFNNGSDKTQKFFKREYDDFPYIWKSLKIGEFCTNFTRQDTFGFTPYNLMAGCNDSFYVTVQGILKRNVRMMFIDTRNATKNIEPYGFFHSLAASNPKFDGAVILDTDPVQNLIYFFNPSNVFEKFEKCDSPECKETDVLSNVTDVENVQVLFYVNEKAQDCGFSCIETQISSIDSPQEILYMMKQNKTFLFSK